MQKDLIFSLHGFLGQSLDWFACEKHLKSALDTHWISPNLFCKDSDNILSFKGAVDNLVAKIDIAKFKAHRKIFIGYSLGARLGLYLLQNHAELFNQFIFVSCHPGLVDEKLKVERIANDEKWGQLLETETWEGFLQHWNSQTTFAKSGLEPARYEKDFDIKKLQAAMRQWTLGKQEFMGPVILQNQKKVSWVVGNKDEKFLQLAEGLKQKKILQDYSRISSGHRILFENPKALALEIQKIIAAIV